MKKPFYTLILISIATLFTFSSALCLAAQKKSDETKSEKKADPAEKTYLLRYHFKLGETVCWDVTHEGRTQATVAGETRITETVSKSVKIWKVTKVNDDGSTVFENQTVDVDMWQKMNGCEEVRYNSNKDKTPPHGYDKTAKRIGKPLARITLDQRGDVKKRVELVEKVGQDTEGQITIPLPEKAIPVGHTWRVPHDVFVPLEGGRTKKVVMQQSFTLKSMKNGVATIAVATQILTPIRDPAIEAKLIDRYRRGTVRFDVTVGRILSQQMDLDKKVIGFRGPDSRVHSKTRFTERLRTSK